MSISWPSPERPHAGFSPWHASLQSVRAFNLPLNENRASCFKCHSTTKPRIQKLALSIRLLKAVFSRENFLELFERDRLCKMVCETRRTRARPVGFPDQPGDRDQKYMSQTLAQ